MAKIKISPSALQKMKKDGRTYTLYLASRGGWGGIFVTPAVHAGVPLNEEDFVKDEIEGIPFFIRKDLVDKSFSINWVGFWVFGNFTVIET